MEVLMMPSGWDGRLGNNRVRVWGGVRVSRTDRHDHQLREQHEVTLFTVLHYICEHH